jgi:hypothetical protein
VNTLTAELKIERNLPPSMNSTRGAGAKGHWRAQHRSKQEWEGLIMVALLEAKVPRGLWSVEARAVLTVPDRIRRDAGNFRFMLEKALGDTLVKCGYLPDDTPEHFTFPELTFEYEKGVKRTTVHLTMEPSLEPA